MKRNFIYVTTVIQSKNTWVQGLKMNSKHKNENILGRTGGR